jgi:hypothetical protein
MLTLAPQVCEDLALGDDFCALNWVRQLETAKTRHAAESNQAAGALSAELERVLASFPDDERPIKYRTDNAWHEGYHKEVMKGDDNVYGNFQGRTDCRCEKVSDPVAWLTAGNLYATLLDLAFADDFIISLESSFCAKRRRQRIKCYLLPPERYRKRQLLYLYIFQTPKELLSGIQPRQLSQPERRVDTLDLASSRTFRFSEKSNYLRNSAKRRISQHVYVGRT